MKIRILHRTRYKYETPAKLGAHVIRLRPTPHGRTSVLSYNLNVEPGIETKWKQSPLSHWEARFPPPPEPVAELDVQVDMVLDVLPINPFDFEVDDGYELLPIDYPDSLKHELAAYRGTPRLGALEQGFFDSVDYEVGGDTVDYLVRLTRAAADRVKYIIREEPGIQTPEETLQKGSGSCRDTALLLVQALRARGFAARFVSGYLVQLRDDGDIPNMRKGVSEDVLDLHAWAEAFLPGAGWVGLDGTSGLLCGEGHIPLACAVDPSEAAPISGTTSRAATGFSFEMQVERLGHEPTPLRPYTDEMWTALREAGDAVDAALDAEGLPLTCGGEPTWTSREHAGDPEWLTEALGPTKWSQGLRMAAQIRDRMEPGALVMSRMGKHYPGESLPRWAIDVLSRRDGVPIWRDPALLRLSGPRDVGSAERDPGPEDARAFAQEVATRLGVVTDSKGAGVSDNGGILPGYEDPWHFIRGEANLPEDVDPLEADLELPEERRRLARALTRGLGEPVGYAVPLQHDGLGFLPTRWRFRREHMFLVPGDSPMGLRLPLDRIAGTRAPHFEADPRDKVAPLPKAPTNPYATLREAPKAAPSASQAMGVAGTALVVEVRERGLTVFIPPTPSAEAFLVMVRAIEDAAATIGRPVRLEGYAPPSDPRLERTTLTPDPGVLEINMTVCNSFREYVDQLEFLAEAARHAGLCTETYQLDGRVAGTGGGNHLTLGGPSTNQSPFLTRGRLLGDLLTYIQAHPSLSYLFTGLFVGPTSQAPRLDEARDDALHELELAMRQLPQGNESIPPWLIDRIFRNLLVDVSGNTHRTEVCIDKLFDPINVAGRQGIVEFRAFEMPPHERMAAAEMFLLRAIILKLVRNPSRQPPTHWGTLLHDRFMLPHYLWEDLREVMHDLREVGVRVDEDWFEPFVALRCPIAGTMEVDGVSVEVRSALEPWHTLGEQPAGSVVARYVDSSVERVQVKVSGMTPGRHTLMVNGYEATLEPTGVRGEGVLGVRFRAWQPPHCLHPTIGVHHPLHFDVVDTWGRRSIGGCRYHVWHPEGHAFNDPPLTRFEAAARRAQRFTTDGHAPYPVAPKTPVRRPEHPHTLDLRWQL